MIVLSEPIFDEAWRLLELPQVLAKKNRGRKHYEARKARISDRIAKAKRTRASDISPRRAGDGIPPNHHLRMLDRSDIFPIIKRTKK